MAEKSQDVVEEKISEVETLIPVSDTVTVDGQIYRVMPFKLGKTLLMIEVVSELLEKTDLAGLVAGGSTEKVVQTLAEELPRIVKHGRPILLRAVALTLTPDKEIAQLEANEEDIRGVMDKKGRVFAGEMEIEQAIDVIALGIRAMGIDTIQKNLPKLTQALGLNKEQ